MFSEEVADEEFDDGSAFCEGAEGDMFEEDVVNGEVETEDDGGAEDHGFWHGGGGFFCFACGVNGGAPPEVSEHGEHDGGSPGWAEGQGGGEGRGYGLVEGGCVEKSEERKGREEQELCGSHDGLDAHSGGSRERVKRGDNEDCGGCGEVGVRGCFGECFCEVAGKSDGGDGIGCGESDDE